MLLTAFLGLAVLLALTWLSNRQSTDSHEPDAEPEVSSAEDIPAPEQRPLLPNEAIRPPGPRPTPHGMLLWLMERCLRRRDRQPDRERYNMYNERVEVLNMVYQMLNSDDERSRAPAQGMLSNMTDISDDEDSPNHQAIHAETTRQQAERMHEFIRSLQAGSALDHGASSFAVERTAQRLLDHPAQDSSSSPADGSSDEVETQSQRRFRYMNSNMEECSDPELWMDLHHT